MEENEKEATLAWVAAYTYLYDQMIARGMWSINLDQIREMILTMADEYDKKYNAG